MIALGSWFYRDSDGLSHPAIWATDIVGLLAFVAILLWLRWSLKEIARPRRWTDERGCLENEANYAWAEYREEAYDHALQIAFQNGDLVDAMKDRARVTGDAFRGLTRVTRTADHTLRHVREQFGLSALDPYSRRV